MKPRLALWDAIGAGLIIEWPSNVVYTNQTGGTSCLHPEAEGIYLPFGNDVLMPSNVRIGVSVGLEAYFEGPKHRGTGATEGLDIEDADTIDALLMASGSRLRVQVDRARLRESHEAWVHVFFEGASVSYLALFGGLEPAPRPAILTWPNSD